MAGFRRRTAVPLFFGRSLSVGQRSLNREPVFLMKAKEQIVAMTKNKGHTILISVGVNFSRHLVNRRDFENDLIKKLNTKRFLKYT